MIPLVRGNEEISQQRFSKRNVFVELHATFSLKLIVSVIISPFCLSVTGGRTNGVGIENSDPATCCDDTFVMLKESLE